VEEKEEVVVREGVRVRCGEASFLFYALSSGPAGPAMLALAGTRRDSTRRTASNLSQANIPPTPSLFADSRAASDFIIARWC
jgi:hypothetical protein